MLELLRQTGLDTGVDRSTQAILAALLLHVLIIGVASLASRWRPFTPVAPSTLFVELDSPGTRADSLQKKLLLSKNRKWQNDESTPENARYFSDRNQRVEKETRAKHPGLAELSQLRSRSLENTIRGIQRKSTSNSNPDLAYQVHGEAQRLADDRLSEGAENLLNTVQNIHYSFYSRMYGSLAPVWQNLVRSFAFQHALSPGDYTVTADLVLDADGNLIGVEFHERSAIEMLNQVVIASARKVAKFPNPPRELIMKDQTIRTLWSFTVNVDEHSLLRLAPPRRID